MRNLKSLITKILAVFVNLEFSTNHKYILSILSGFVISFICIFIAEGIYVASVYSVLFGIVFVLVHYYKYILHFYRYISIEMILKPSIRYIINFIITLFLAYYFNYNIVYAANPPAVTINYHLDEFLNNVPDEDLPLIENLLNQVQNVPTTTQYRSVPQPRNFGWESLALFIGASVVAYVIIQHSSHIFSFFRNIVSELLSNISIISRESIRVRLHDIALDPANHERLYRGMELYVQAKNR
jgi:hypothetical protein